MALRRSFCWLTLICVVSIIEVSVSTYRELPHCVHHDIPLEKLIFVSTLDGRMTALNAITGGMVVWSIDTGPGPLLSSSIDKLELTSNGHWVRMIPSLSGGIYKFNGMSIETVPITADSLLQTSSLLLSDGLVISGGRESRIYGVAFETGEVLYECSMKGCDNYNVSDNIMVIQRHTQTIRAIDIHTGTERWNFSVGQHEVKYTLDSTCHKKQSEVPSLNFELKAVLPEGLVCAVDKLAPEKVLWKYKFDSPVVAIWQMENGQTRPVDLFSDIRQHNQARSAETALPALYIGMHKKQLYIQESVSLLDKTRKDLTRFVAHETLEIPWQPVPASGAVLGIASEQNVHNDLTQTQTTALSVLYASEYVNGNGYYLFANDNAGHHNQCSISKETITTDDDNGNTSVNIVIISLWYWWKEVLIISITTAVLVNVLVTQRVIHIVQSSSQMIHKEITVEKPAEHISTDSSSVISEGSQSSEFVSRYLSDFEPVQCLGKGGFGVVFEAKNKIDDCKYAIKRIVLPNSLESRDRVLREVKALAKLDHQHIVRYFNAWMECPPTGWMEQHDLVYLKQNKVHTSDIIDIESTDEQPSTPEDSNTGILAEECSTPVLVHPFQDNTSFEARHPQIKNEESDSFIVFEKSEEADQKTLDRSRQVSLLCEESSESLLLSNSISFIDKHFTSIKEEERQNSLNKHSHVIPIPTKIYLYIQMQLCHRESLREWLSDSVRDKCKVLLIFEQIVQAVEYIHLEGLIHRDLKPSNIFFSMNGQIKVGDFGLVTTMDKSVAIDNLDRSVSCDSVIKDQEIHTAQVGTQLYMSPEQVKGEPYDYKVDIYSLGLIFFELVYPFSTQMERINILLDLRRNVFPKNFQQDYCEESELLQLMLSHHPQERPTTFGIRARPPLRQSSACTDEQENNLYHFNLPSQCRKSNLSKGYSTEVPELG